MNTGKRVVVTGAGALSSFGPGIDPLWDSLVAGKSGVDHISLFDTSEHPSKIAAEVKNFNPEDFMSKKEVKKYDRFLHFSKAAVKMCMEDFGCEITEEEAPNVGVAIGSGTGGMWIFQDSHQVLLEKGPSRVSPFFIPMMLINMAPGMAAIDYNLRGPNFSVVSACATGAHNIGIAYNMIKSGTVTMMLAGGADGAITPLSVAGFSAMKALSCSNDEPTKASRPFDKKRDGFVIGEGAAMVMLEELEHAKARGAKIYGEIAGFGMSADAHHITQPDPDGRGAVSAMQMAIKDAQITPDKIDYINTHGTSTPLGDIAETNAIKKVFGDHAYKVAVSSSKSMTGHLLGAAGAIEAIITLLSVKNNIVTPTINLEDPDPECDLDYTPNKAKERNLNYAISNSFGFGGTNSVLVIKKYME